MPGSCSGRLLVLLLSATPLATSVTSSDEVCDEGSDGVCQASSGVRRQLRWRGYPYRVSHPKFARTIYGGDYIVAAFRDGGFDGPVEDDDWDLLWTHRMQPTLPLRKTMRLVNHCGYFKAAGDKCSFSRHVKTLQLGRRKSAADSIHLQTFELDDADDFRAWQASVHADPTRYWIFKPCLGGASRGITVLRGQAALEKSASFASGSVAQEYLSKPFLGFGGRKFHLRLYVLVVSWMPVRAFLYDEGLIFRSRRAYRKEEAPNEQHDIFSAISDTVEGLSLSVLWQHIDKTMGSGTTCALQERIAKVLRSLLGQRLRESFGGFSGSNPKQMLSCFDLFGADVILDHKLRPFLMEFNTGPNMWISDHGEGHKEQLFSVKDPMIRQVVHWAALRIQRAENSTEAEASESEIRQALRNFTRVV